VSRRGHEFRPAGDDGRRGQRRPGGGGGDQAAGFAQRGAPAGEVLRDGVGAEDVGDDQRPGPARPHVGAHRSQRPGGVGVGPVADDDVEEDDADVGIARLLLEDLDPGAGSIIGCGRPRVYSSAPWSRQTWLPGGAGRPQPWRSGVLEYTGPSAPDSSTSAS